MCHQYFWLYKTPVTANTVTLIFYTFGQLTGGKTLKSSKSDKKWKFGGTCTDRLSPIGLKFGM